MANGEDTRNHPNRKVDRGAIGRAMVQGLNTLPMGTTNPDEDLSMRVAKNIGQSLEASGAKYIGDPMTVRFPVNEKNYRSVSVNDPSQAQDSSYNEDAATFIETGVWGALDPEQNQHLIPHRERYLRLLEND